MLRLARRFLSPREQRVLDLIYVWGWSNRDVAVRLGVNESRVSQLKSRALLRLRQQLEAVGGGCRVSGTPDFESGVGTGRASRRSVSSLGVRSLTRYALKVTTALMPIASRISCSRAMETVWYSVSS